MWFCIFSACFHIFPVVHNRTLIIIYAVVWPVAHGIYSPDYYYVTKRFGSGNDVRRGYYYYRVYGDCAHF